MTIPYNKLQPSLALQMVMVSGTSDVFPTDTGSGLATGDTYGFVYDFAGTMLPGGSSLANGQLLPNNSDSALLSVIGDMYGGNPTSEFALPNLQGNVVIGTNIGQTPGAVGGSAAVTLTVADLPAPQGGGQPFSNLEPSLTLETLICTSGNFPSTTGTVYSSFIGEIAEFAGNYIPDGWTLAAGQSLPVSNNNSSLLSVLGITYGGDGKNDFDLPNLQGRLAVGADAAHPLGSVFGQASITLTTSELPPGGAPVSNDQASLAVEYLIAAQGLFPTDSKAFDPSTPTVGEIVAFAGNYAPAGWLIANGQTLDSANYFALANVLGDTYGGNGTTTFALPDLSGRTPIGADGTDFLVGSQYGSDTTTLAADNIPACYCRGTLVLTGAGEIAIETLRIGDAVRTASGALRPIKWIGRRGYARRFALRNPDVQPVLIRAGALDNGVPDRDLLVSPMHAMLLDGLLIPAKCLVNGVSVVRTELETVEYFHFELGTHDVIYANGAQSESFVDDDSRTIFENAHEYATLYPRERRVPARYCAPRVAEGFALDAIRQRLGERAGTRRRAAAAPLRGFLDRVGARVIEGWAQNPDHPDAPVCVDVFVEGAFVARTLANRDRPDLRAAGYRDGRHGFSVQLPAALTLGQCRSVEVRRSSDHAVLPRTEATTLAA